MPNLEKQWTTNFMLPELAYTTQYFWINCDAVWEIISPIPHIIDLDLA